MNKISEKIQLYKQKKKILKENSIEDFHMLSDNIKKQYIDIYNKKELINGISYLSILSLITHLIEYVYTINLDNDLKHDIFNIIYNGINPIVNDIKDPLYAYLTIMTIISYIMCYKSIEIGKNINNFKLNYEKIEPKLKGFKFIDN